MKQHAPLHILVRLLDVLVIFVSLPVIVRFNGLKFSQEYQMAALLAALLTWMVMGSMRHYRARRGFSVATEIRILSLAYAIIVAALLVIAWFAKDTQYYSRLVVGEWVLLSYCGMVAVHLSCRFCLRWLRKRGYNSRTAIVFGAGPVAGHLVEQISSADWLGIKLLGCYSDVKKQGEMVRGVRVLGNTLQGVAMARDMGVDIVYIAMSASFGKKAEKLLDSLHDCTASVYLVPDLFMFDLMQARPQEVNGVPVFSFLETPMLGPFGMLKRLEDIVVSSLILMLIWPLLLSIALLVKLDSPGPAIFRQHRYGLNGKKVEVWKFRSMRVMENGSEIKQAGKGDPRVTRIGAFLRKSSLDELPQFINVLQGHMSVVGPRPHAVAHNEMYRKLIKGYMWRHKVKPGITGWAQVNGWRGETETLDKMKNRVECDLDYVRHWSIWLDLKIIWMTVWKGFCCKNAY